MINHWSVETQYFGTNCLARTRPGAILSHCSRKGSHSEISLTTYLSVQP